MRQFFLIFAISLIVSVGANAQIHPATSAIASASPSLAPPLPSGNGDGTIISSVFEGPSRFEAGIEYSWMHAEAAPNLNYNLNGFVGSLSWFLNRDIGVEGQLLGGWGGAPSSAKLAFAGGGVHARFNTSNRLQPWAHALIGHAHLHPQTLYGGQTTFAWEVGGGVDYRFISWVSLRVGADAFGTDFFHVNQVSPVVHAGVVFNF
ncbi:MAG: hypothetical protein WA766_06765 [Candidatus Acidiferrales bacterium]